MNPSENSYDVAVVTCILKYIQYHLQGFFYQSWSPLETSCLFAADCIILGVVPSKHVRPNPDVAPHWQASWWWWWSSSSSPSSSPSSSSSSSSPSPSHHHIMIIITLRFATPIGVLSSWGVKFSPPPLNNMLLGVITSTISPWGIKFATPYEQSVGWGNNINFIFMRGQNLPPSINNIMIG